MKQPPAQELHAERKETTSCEIQPSSSVPGEGKGPTIPSYLEQVVVHMNSSYGLVAQVTSSADSAAGFVRNEIFVSAGSSRVVESSFVIEPGGGGDKGESGVAISNG